MLSKITLLVLLLAGFIGNARSCSIKINSITDIYFTWTGSTVDVNGIVELSRDTTGNDCRRFHITMTQGDASSYNRVMKRGVYELPFNLYRNRNRTRIIYDYPNATSNGHIIRGMFAFRGNTVIKNFYARMPLPPFPESIAGGFYFDKIIAKVFDGMNIEAGSTLHDTNGFLVSTDVPKMVSLSLIDRGAGYNENDTTQDLDFGVLEPLESLGMDLRVKSNAGHQITFYSQNEGRLKHVNSNDTVSYFLRVNGRSKNLVSASPVIIGQRGGVSSLLGDLYKVDIQIANFSNKAAGLYNDTITVEVATTE